MDKSCHSFGVSTTSTTAGSSGSSNVNNIGNRDHYLKHLNKLSHKISKPSTNAPPIIKKASFDNTQAVPPQQQPQSSDLQPQNPNQSGLQAQQHQPPVYNINKNDFRDVVQKLTGSPAHERFSAPPPIHQPKPQSSRLQRIRPPPLAHVSNRPAPPMINCAVPNMNPLGCSQPTLPISGPLGSSFVQRPPAGAPLSPLPPFPAVHAAAESPVSAYLRYFQSSVSSAVDTIPKQFSGFPPLAPLISPRWNNLTAAQQQPPPPPQQPHRQQQQPPQVSSTGINQSQLPSSSLPFGFLNSPRSPYPLLSPSLLFSPNSGQLGFPLSPTVPVPSPKGGGL
ncbi:VQ motif-containing protein 9 [Hibiscus syriacus]|uniref:VQ motif-containing protein 9 n=1 Tax=Hibiscus syriacus TaxID=106335 RepID=A0A6A2XSN3_HIBSY|nr:VQ motif-containing protein 9-like [Hibiscus syriacus]KAE8659267.1 VQ motif-containing protein 9 [Hibiscus syriacus]